MLPTPTLDRPSAIPHARSAAEPALIVAEYPIDYFARLAAGARTVNEGTTVRPYRLKPAPQTLTASVSASTQTDPTPLDVRPQARGRFRPFDDGAMRGYNSTTMRGVRYVEIIGPHAPPARIAAAAAVAAASGPVGRASQEPDRGNREQRRVSADAPGGQAIAPARAGRQLIAAHRLAAAGARLRTHWPVIAIVVVAAAAGSYAGRTIYQRLGAAAAAPTHAFAGTMAQAAAPATTR